MIKKLILAVAMVLPMSLLAQKFGTVDVESVLTAMPATTAAQQQIDEASKKYEAEFSKMQEEFQKSYADFQAIQDDANTPATIKERRMQEIQAQGQRIEQFRATATQDLQRQHEQLMAPIQKNFTDAVKAVGQENGFTFIFPNDPGLMLYTGADVVDVTAMVKEKLGVK